MPLQNRVTPFGTLIATSEYGTLMGNRGILHDGNRTITKRWTHHSWILCQLTFRNRKRIPMSPGKYTELFFLDEATGLAAGHRPCAECQRDRYDKFKQLFIAANADQLTSINLKSASQKIDYLLKQDRLCGWGRYAKQRTYQATLSTLPNGTFIVKNGQPFLLLNNQLYRWTVGGYTENHIATNVLVTVLTPRCLVKTLQLGFNTNVHFSAE